MEITNLGVLIVDDHEDARQMMAMVLNGLGVREIRIAESGLVAQEILAGSGTEIDLVVCDWEMPGMSGLDFLKFVRGINPDLPFMMVTGNADAERVRSAMEHGVTAYVAKPYSPQQFEEKLKAMVRKF